ncbi:MAG: sigma-70 family RNA polymerase sigma factor [Pirellulales bacterium]|nr:sigma-70 family RNA polymerase sigma factor [Pirellulales bacterium]
MTEVAGALDIADLVAQHHAAVYRYAYRLTGGETDAEDLTQQTFLIAQRKLDQLREPAAARNWLFTILRHVFSKSLRKNRPRPARDLLLDLENIPEQTPPDSPIDHEELQKALDELPPDFRLVLVMFFFEDCSYRQMAEQLEIPIGTVMSRLARAKAQLKATLFIDDGQPSTNCPTTPVSKKRRS